MQVSTGRWPVAASVQAEGRSPAAKDGDHVTGGRVRKWRCVDRFL